MPDEFILDYFPSAKISDFFGYCDRLKMCFFEFANSIRISARPPFCLTVRFRSNTTDRPILINKSVLARFNFSFTNTSPKSFDYFELIDRM